jgi:hypothetical protein
MTLWTFGERRLRSTGGSEEEKRGGTTNSSFVNESLRSNKSNERKEAENPVVRATVGQRSFEQSKWRENP